MLEAINAMEEAFKMLSSEECMVPQRMVASIAEGKSNLILKPVSVDTKNRASIKILTQKESGALGIIPAIVGIVLLLDSKTGEILSIMDGEYLTAIRTGAASGLATKYFSNQNAETLAIFGCGTQGKTQLEAVAEVRNLKKVWLFDINKNIADKLKNEVVNKFDFEVEVATSHAVLKDSDIICTATNSENPLFKFSDLKEGVHINAIGSFKPNMQEIDPQILNNARIYVDQKNTCLAESGDFIKPINEGIFKADQISGEIGEYLLKKVDGRKSESDITIFKSVGVAIQDFIVANRIYEKSQTNNFGIEFNLFE